VTRRLIVLGTVVLLVSSAATGVTQAARKVAFPDVAATCKPAPPVLLRPGSEPRVPLRLDLAATAHRTAAVVDTERVHATVTGPSGIPTTPTDTTQTFRIAILPGRPAHGRLPVTIHMSVPGASAKQAAALRRLRTVGYVDTLNGGRTKTGLATGATASDDGPQTDHLPRQAVGIGASWRVVNCDELNSTPARETRTYTLRSITHGVVVASYRDVIGMDPAHIDLGSAKLASGTAHFKLLSLDGTATGSFRLPLANGFAQRSNTTSHVEVVFLATSSGATGVKIRTSFVSRESTTPDD
jgi:hypothetical protein